MKLMVSIATATAVVLPLLTVVGTVNAREIERFEFKDNRKCYRVQRVPAKIIVDTRGQLVRQGEWGWKDGEKFKSGSKIALNKSDDVYIATEEVVEDQHTTLFETKC